jgi:hypothetical protein
MRRVTAWTLGALLVLVIFGALGAAVEAIRSMPPTEGMMGGLNVTSDDLVGYAESNAYGDSSDAKMYGDISWKIKTCSTITQADLNRAVNDAVTKAKSNCRRGYYE